VLSISVHVGVSGGLRQTCETRSAGPARATSRLVCCSVEPITTSVAFNSIYGVFEVYAKASQNALKGLSSNVVCCLLRYRVLRGFNPIQIPRCMLPDGSCHSLVHAPFAQIRYTLNSDAHVYDLALLSLRLVPQIDGVYHWGYRSNDRTTYWLTAMQDGADMGLQDGRHCLCHASPCSTGS
jgi:hypothetical protein